jgi:hypothetical protein
LGDPIAIAQLKIEPLVGDAQTLKEPKTDEEK